MTDLVNSDEPCSNCDTQQLQFEDYAGCLCTIISDVELDYEERIIKLLKDKHNEIAPDHFDNFSAGIHIGYRRAIQLLTGESDDD